MVHWKPYRMAKLRHTPAAGLDRSKCSLYCRAAETVPSGHSVNLLIPYYNDSLEKSRVCDAGRRGVCT
jgi:hypothetical protein